MLTHQLLNGCDHHEPKSPGGVGSVGYTLDLVGKTKIEQHDHLHRERRGHVIKLRYLRIDYLIEQWVQLLNS